MITGASPNECILILVQSTVKTLFDHLFKGYSVEICHA
jgi:hypothetical protein